MEFVFSTKRKRRCFPRRIAFASIARSAGPAFRRAGACASFARDANQRLPLARGAVTRSVTEGIAWNNPSTALRAVPLCPPLRQPLSAALRLRQAGRCLETRSLHPPQAALHSFPLSGEASTHFFIPSCVAGISGRRKVVPPGRRRIAEAMQIRGFPGTGFQQAPFSSLEARNRFFSFEGKEKKRFRPPFPRISAFSACVSAEYPV